MGEKVRRVENKEIHSGLVAINLFGPGMTSLHKVGLAGLWMTLKALEADKEAMGRLHKTGGSWERTESSVTLRWEKKPEPFFKQLFEESFKIDKNGLFWSPALGEPISYKQQAVILNEAMHSIHFQVPKTRGAGKQRRELVVDIDGAQEILRFLPFEWISHQRASKLLSHDFVRVVGWLLPGATRRHEVHKETAHEEPLERFLCLLYVPVGSIYFRVKQKRARPKGKNRGSVGVPDFAMAVFDIHDIVKYASLRKTFLPFGTHDLTVAGTSEAAWRALVTAYACGLLEVQSLNGCRVVSFGSSPGTRQKTRVEIFTVRPSSDAAFKVFNYCRHVFPSTLVEIEGKEPFWDIPQIPELVAENLSDGYSWWEGFANFVEDKERRKHVFKYEIGGLEKMVENKDVLPESPERIFVLACHEGLRRHMGRKFARPGGADWGNEFEKVRVSLARCKNAATFRESITDFWARGGSLHKGEDTLLKAGASWWQDVMSLLDEKNWRKAKDLSLLALASYPGSKDEPEVKAANQTAAKGGK